jgi:hypothetical protein
MHAYPDDLRTGGKEVAELFSRSHVAFVGTGHTHYNELVNHESVIYAATRSTGEVEEGSPGFSLGVLDGSVVGWHFKPVDVKWPLVMISSPSDCRLVTDPFAMDQVPAGTIHVRAKVFGVAIEDVTARVDRGPPVVMVEDAACVWRGLIPDVADGLCVLAVEATTADGQLLHDTIRVLVRSKNAKAREVDHSLHQQFEPLGAWPERGLLGTQLGPNKNGRKW